MSALHRSVHWKIALLPALLALLLTATALALVAAHLHEQTEMQARARVEHRAQLVADRMAGMLDRQVRMAELLAQDRALQDGQPPAVMRARLDAVLRATPGVAWIGRVDLSGLVRAGTHGLLEGESIATRPVFQHGLAGLYLGDVHAAVALQGRLPGSAGKELSLIDVAIPLRDDAGRKIGVLTMHVYRDEVAALIEHTVASGDSSLGLQMLIFDSAWQHVVIGQAPANLAGLLPTLRALRPPAAGAASGDDHGSGARRVRHLEQDWLVAEADMVPGFPRPALGWHIIALQSLPAAFAPQRDFLIHMSLAGAVLALLFGGLGYVASRRLIRPYQFLLAGLARHAEQLGAQNAASLTLHLDALSHELPHWLPPATAGELRDPGERMLRLIGHDIEQLRQVLDLLPVAVMVQDTAGRWRYWNARCEQLLGWSARQALGRTPPELWAAPAEAPDWLAAPGEGAALRSSDHGEADLHSHAGALLTVQWQRTPLHNAQGQPLGWLTILHDVTEQHQAQQQLRIAAAAFEQQQGIVVTDPNGVVLRVNRAFSLITGYTSAEVVGRTTESQRADRLDAAFYAARDEQLRQNDQWSGRVWNRRKNGEVYPVWLQLTTVRDAAGRRSNYVGSLIDITEIDRAERALRDSQQELNAMTQRLLVQEKITTRRVAQALHDRLGQTLAAAVLQSGLLQVSGALAAWPAESQRICDRLDSLLQQAVAEVRRVLVDLRPPLLEEDGLPAALDNQLALWEADAQGAGTELQLQISFSAREQRWPAEVEYAAFMVAREAVFNALRHAHATTIAVALDGDASHLVLHVADDGAGLPADAAEAMAVRAGHLGLVGMRDRAGAIGARLRWISSPGAGATVELFWEAPA